MEIKQQLVTSTKYVISGTNPDNYIIVHQTGNTDKGANSQAHANIQSRGNERQASWQYQVDDIQIIQSFRDNQKCMHGSDGASGIGNAQGIGIELCVNSDADYDKVLENGAWLVRHLMLKHSIPISHVLQHHDVAPDHKNCPQQIRSGKNGTTWNDFLNMVQGSEVSSSRPSQLSKHGVSSGSITDYLNSIGMDSSFSNRSKLAVQYGVVSKQSQYRGTASQNISLLNVLKKGKKTSKPASTSGLPKTVRGAKLVKKENAAWTVTAKNGVIVRADPSVKARRTGNLPKGAKIHYDAVYKSSGYRWLTYIGNSGNRLYVPYRPLSKPNEVWGRFSSN